MLELDKMQQGKQNGKIGHIYKLATNQAAAVLDLKLLTVATGCFACSTGHRDLMKSAIH